MGIRASRKKSVEWSSIADLQNVLFDMYETNKQSLNEISRSLNISPDRVKKKLTELGFTIRSREESYTLAMEEFNSRNQC